MLGIHVAAYMDSGNTMRASRDRKALVGFVGFHVGFVGFHVGRDQQTPAPHGLTMWSDAVLRGAPRARKHIHTHPVYSTCHEKQHYEDTRARRHTRIRNPDFLHSGMLVGVHPTLVTCRRTQLP